MSSLRTFVHACMLYRVYNSCMLFSLAWCMGMHCICCQASQEPQPLSAGLLMTYVMAPSFLNLHFCWDASIPSNPHK